MTPNDVCVTDFLLKRDSYHCCTFIAHVVC